MGGFKYWRHYDQILEYGLMTDRLSKISLLRDTSSESQFIDTDSFSGHSIICLSNLLLIKCLSRWGGNAWIISFLLQPIHSTLQQSGMNNRHSPCFELNYVRCLAAGDYSVISLWLMMNTHQIKRRKMAMPRRRKFALFTKDAELDEVLLGVSSTFTS